MHNHKYLLQFRCQPSPLDRENAIITGAAREIAVQRAQSKNTTNAILQSVTDPIQARGRVTARARRARGTTSRGRAVARGGRLETLTLEN